MKPGLALFALAAALGTFVARPAVAEHAPSLGAASSEDGMNHAAVVVDTGDGVVRKMCLAFPEAELSGIEALRRVDTRPNRFETFSGKGSGVCMLCGVGCASGDCFCDPDQFWAYHRAGPAETRYRTSPLGASSTIVRNGDVEAWKWGNGAAPAKTSVSEVCGVPEPAARTTSNSTTTSAPPGETTTSSAQPPAAATPSSVPTAPPETSPTTARAGASGTPTAQPPGTPAPPTAGDVVEVPIDGDPSTSGSAAEDRSAADGRAASAQDPTGAGGSGIAQFVSLGAFAALMAGLLVWKARLRRANRRGARPVR